MLVLYLSVLFSLTLSSWSYDPDVVLGLAEGELQVKRFTHPPDDHDFAWLIDDDHDKFGFHQSDFQSSTVAQPWLPQTSSFQQPLTSSSETLAQLLNDYPPDSISQAHQLTGKRWFNSKNHIGEDPLSYHSVIHLPQHGSYAEWFYQPSDLMHIAQPEFNQFNPHCHFVPNYQNLNANPGSFWTKPILQGQSVEGANLPRPYLSSPGHNENLVNEEVANSHLIKPSEIPNIFENDIASTTFSSRINDVYDTKSYNLEPDWIQGFKNRNLWELEDHEKSTLGLPGASSLDGDNLSLRNHSPEEFEEKITSSHPSPQSDVNFDLFLNDLIYSPHHQAEEKGNLGFVKGHESSPQNINNINSELKIEKTHESGSDPDSPLSNSPWSTVQQIRDLIPNVELHSNNLNSYSDNDSLSQLRGENYLNNVESPNSQQNNILMKERQPRKKQKTSKLQRLRIKYIKDFNPLSESFRKYLEENLEPGSSDLIKQSALITPTENLNLRENKKFKNIIDPISSENNKIKTDKIKKRKRTRKNSENLVETENESGRKTASSKKRKERTTYHQGFNSKIGLLGYFGKHHVSKRPSICYCKE
ncbi:hypothetical protein PPACK8108_LOCUS15546 [Phakopsora pachyrhizi]|uniref:Uncharacterized protein n=1 Tax=Phakopsora pachyrhizi TaxID=170000 RepID=A0AAV0B9Z9_PHAPC|nr:hypothetical protein PPACK8108_LOCUS15546 [Phakopsora pachyrhizi]